MLGFVVIFAGLWVVWALSPLSAPLIAPGSDPLPHMLDVLKYAAITPIVAVRLDGIQAITSWSTRIGGLLAVPVFALVAYPSINYAVIAWLSEPRAHTGLGRILPKALGHLIDWYSLQGLLLLAACAVWIGVLGWRAIRN